MRRDSDCNDNPPLLGLVLAGGRSRRFGRDKAGIEVNGQVLLDLIFTILDSVCERVFVSVRADQVDEELRKRYALIADDKSGSGPAGGILAAHAHRPDVAWLVVACDMPCLDEDSISRLIESRRPEKAATGYRSPSNGLPEPLCAIWEPATLESFRQRAQSGGSLSPRDMLIDTDVELVHAADARALENINTQADLDRLEFGSKGNA